MSKKDTITYEPIAPPEDWKQQDERPVIIKRPLIQINLTTQAARTFGRFILWSVVIVAAESLIYMLVAGLNSAPGVIGTKTVEQPVRDDFGDPLTFYPGFIIALAAVYVIAIVVWWFNRER